ncbi:hypothetical protein [Stutzerimonas nitrititolerans]|uniref:hypothetical protein n=1 Tax=Stutzerimonas nitrititolerans TaxID=2482751 RepID=UPI0028B14A15|nr:hypothetical protein [Stutzerimonas nitrititolerans]
MIGHVKTPWAVGVFEYRRKYSRWSPEQVAEARALESRKIFSGSQPVAFCESPGDAARIVACVNACAGISTDALEYMNGSLRSVDQMSVVEAQRDELLAALEACKCHLANSLHLVRVHVPEHHWLTQIATGLDEAKAAIAKAQGGAS